jgi:fructose-bisphosphate aldolase class 1
MVDLATFVEVKLKEQDDFLKVRETLTRIGVSSRKENMLYQSCHILHKKGQYYIVHFKELFALDGKPSSIVDNDIERRNAIAKLLEEWGLVTIVNPEIMIDKIAPLHQIKIISYRDKDQWQLVSKYNIGKKPQE